MQSNFLLFYVVGDGLALLMKKGQEEGLVKDWYNI
jgi:hypothetical protein